MTRFLTLLLTLVVVNSYAHNNNHVDKTPNEPVVLAPGYSALTFEAPLAGSYELPPLGKAYDGQVINSKNQSLSLDSLLGDKVVLLSFIYATCNDVNGCPLSTAVFHKIKNRLAKETSLHSDLRLLTLSFDPTHDTSEVMKEYAKSLTAGSDTDWHFLTTKSQTELQPILQNYNQTIQQEVDENGKETGTFSHTLRVYLIDKKKTLRNIYSVGFLHPDILINDVKTLLLEDGKEHRANTKKAKPIYPELHGTDDVKTSYETKQYQTQSKSLLTRKGNATDLFQLAMNPPLGLPSVPTPKHNPLKKKQSN